MTDPLYPVPAWALLLVSSLPRTSSGPSLCILLQLPDSDLVEHAALVFFLRHSDEKYMDLQLLLRSSRNWNFEDVALQEPIDEVPGKFPEGRQ